MRIKKKKLKKLRLKKIRKKSQKVLFKTTIHPPPEGPKRKFGRAEGGLESRKRAPKPLEWTKQAKIKKPSKPTKLWVRKTKPKHIKTYVLGKPIKAVKPRKPKLAKPIEPPIYKARIKVIGIGGGGSSIVSEIASQVRKGKFLVANTDFQALQRAAKETKRFQFGKSLTHGLGTGMNPEIGEQAAESEKDKIKEILKETDFCVLVSCLGGGTGSGASPVFARILKNLRISTLGIFTLPFEFEGGKKAQIAKDSLEKLKPNLNALFIIPNQKIFQIIDASTGSASILSGNRRIDKNTPLKEALSTINKALIESLEGLITLIYSPGLIHVDFADLKTILAGRGRLVYLNTVEAKSPNQIEELAKGLLSNPLLPYSVQGAKEILFNIDGGLNLNIGQIEQIGKTISDSINPQARVAFGITQSKKEGIKITLLANGCKWEEWEREKEKPKKKPKEKQTLITKIQDYNPPTALPLSRAPKLNKKTEKKPPELPKIQQPKITQIPTKEQSEEVKIQVRKNALDYNPPTTSSHSLRERAPIKKSIEEEEKKILTQERKWETPAFLRRQSSQNQEELEK